MTISNNTYLTVSEFRTLAFPKGSFANLEDDEIQYNIDVASNMVDAALRTHHTLPLVIETDRDIGFIKDMVLVIASYRLLQFRGFKPNASGSPDQGLIDRYREVIAPENGLLAQLSSGKLLLDKQVDQTSKRERRSRIIGSTSRSNSSSSSLIRYDSRGNVIVGI